MPTLHMQELYLHTTRPFAAKYGMTGVFRSLAVTVSSLYYIS